MPNAEDTITVPPRQGTARTSQQASPTAASNRAGGFGMVNLGKHSLIYGLGIILTKAVSFLMLPVYTRFLTLSDYGILQLITMTMEVITIFAGSRIAFGVFRYYHKAEDEPSRRAVLSTALLMLAATYGLAALVTLALAPQIAAVVSADTPNFATYVRLAAANMAFEGLIIVPLALYQLRDRSRAFVAVSLAKLAMQVVLNLILLIVFKMGVAGVLLSGLLTNLVFGGFLAAQTLREVGVQFRQSAARDFLRFGLPLVVMQGATFILTFGDRYFLNRAADESAVGLYGLAYQFGFLVATMGFMPFQRVWDPQRFVVAKRPDRDAVYSRVFIYLNLVLISAAVALSMFAGDLLRVIAAPAFQSAATFVPVIVAAYVLQCWGNFLNVGIYIKEKTEYFTVANWIAALVALAGYLILIPRWHAWGAAIATFASLAARCWLAHVFSQRLWRVRYDWTPIRKLVALGIVLAILASLPARMMLPLSIAVHLGFFAVYLAGVWWLVLSAEERSNVASAIAQRMRGRPAMG